MTKGKTKATTPRAFNKIKAGLEDAIAFAKGDTTRGRIVTVKVRPQTTIVHVAVTTAGPVPMVRVREWLEVELSREFADWQLIWPPITRIRVKRDADIQSPRG